MTHTPEPWYYEPCSTANCWCGTITTVLGSDRTEDGVVSAGAMKQADVLRAIACVNACAGIADPAALRRERDELLAALKGLLKESQWFTKERQGQYGESYRPTDGEAEAQAAILKAEGGAA